MSQAAVSIYADIELRKDKLAAQGKEARDILMKSFGGSGAGAMAPIPLNVELPKDLAQRLQATLSTLKIPTINVPINFTANGMPSMPGMSGMGLGSASPNWAYYFGQLQQQMQAAGTGSSPATGAAPGGYGGNSNLYNPFSPRGLARMVGSGLAVYSALATTHVAAGLVNASETLNNPDRILRGMETVGSRHNAADDPFLRVQSRMTAINQSQTEARSAIEGVPLIGSLMKFINAIDGSTRALEDSAKQIATTTEIYKYAQGEIDTAKQKAADLTHDPRISMAEAHRQEREIDAADIKKAEHTVQNAKNENEKNAAIVSLNEVKEANRRKEANRGTENDWLQRDIDSADLKSWAKIQLSGASEAETDAVREGNPITAMGFARNAKLKSMRRNYEATMKSANPLEAERLKREMPFVLSAEEKKLDLDLDRAKAARGADLGNQRSRIQSIGNSADERSLRANGEEFAARYNSIEREGAEKAAALRREAEVLKLKDATAAQLKLNEAVAVEKAARQDINSLITEESHKTHLIERSGYQALREATLDASGAHHDARRQAVEDKFQNEMEDIQREGGPDMMRRMAAAGARRDAAMIGVEANRTQQNIGLADRGIAAAAEGAGQQGVGEVLGVKRMLQAAYQDAGGDRKQSELVDNLKKAEVSRLARQFRPISHTYGLAEYYDALQSSISSGQSTQQARGMLGGIMGMNVANAGNPADNMTDAANQLKDAAKKIKDAPIFGIVGRN